MLANDCKKTILTWTMLRWKAWVYLQRGTDHHIRPCAVCGLKNSGYGLCQPPGSDGLGDCGCGDAYDRFYPCRACHPWNGVGALSCGHHSWGQTEQLCVTPCYLHLACSHVPLELTCRGTFLCTPLHACYACLCCDYGICSCQLIWSVTETWT